MEKPLVNKKYRLEKYPGKGGWTFARIPEIPPDPHAHFGWVRVKGTIDGQALKNFHLMPLGNGQLFLPVRAGIRKILKKEAGDWVQVVLYPDQGPLEIPPEWQDCLKDEPRAGDYFYRLPDSGQKSFLDWIFAVKSPDSRAARMAAALDQLLKGQEVCQKIKPEKPRLPEGPLRRRRPIS